jgi:hypothetical protein
MPQFLSKEDMKAADLSGALDDLGAVRQAALPDAVAAAVPNVLAAALPAALPSALATTLPTALPSPLAAVLPNALTTALPGALPAALPSALASTLPAALPNALTGATGPLVTTLGDQNTSVATGEALKYLPPASTTTPTKSRNARAFYNFRKTFVMVGDYGGGIQDDCYEAAHQNKVLLGDKTANLVITNPIKLPQNIKFDGDDMRILDNTSAAFGGVAAGQGAYLELDKSEGGGGTADYGYLKNIRLDPGLVSETLPSGTTVQRPRLNRNVDGIALGTDPTSAGAYIRQFTIENVKISGLRKAVTGIGSNVFIVTFRKLIVSSGWQVGFEFSSPINSGEKVSFEDCTIAGIKNKIGNGDYGRGVYITPTGVDPGINLGNTSVDYCDVLAEVCRGQLTMMPNSWAENGIDLPMFIVRRTSGKQPSTLRLGGKIVTQGPIGIGSDWTGRGGESPGGRPVLIAVYGNGNVLDIAQVDMGNYSLNRMTELYQMMDGGTLGKFVSGHVTDAGYARMDGNGALDNTTSPLGIGQPFLTSRDRNNFYLGTTAANLTGGFTSFSGLGTGTERYLPRGGALSALRVLTSGTAVSGLAGQQETVKVGDRVQTEMWIHVKSITAGYIAAREQFLAEDIAQGVTPTLTTPAVWDSQYGATTGGFTGRLTTASPESSATATITIPDANFPTRGLFTPGTMVQGTFTVGMELSGLNGAGITGRCWIRTDNGDGTFNVYLEQGTAVTAQTIIGWTKIVSHRPVPNGAKLVRSGPFVSNFQGEVYISGLNREIRRA